jgi:alkylation response protein AidB-like acyl-CoA dehydrogenase
MHIGYPPAIEQFRDEVRAWLRTALPDGWFEGRRPDGADAAAFAEVWNGTLHAEGWATPMWPERYGGRGLDPMRATVWSEEVAAAGAPIQPPAGGELLVGPTILHLGDDAQRDRYLRPIARGEEVWCQGFSEPGSGSDLASLTTAGRVDGDRLVIDGHKIWTSQAQEADMMFLLVRTDPEASAHRGISYVLLPMHQPGIEVRSIAQPDGTAGFAEVLLDGATTPLTNVVGGLGNGWKVAMSTLGFERGTSATSSWFRYDRDLRDIIEAARRRGVLDDAETRQRIARAWSRIQIMRMQSLQVLTAVVHPRTAEATRGIEATTKMSWTEFHQELSELAIDVRGVEAIVLAGDGRPAAGVGLGHREPLFDYQVDEMQSAFLFSRAGTIFGGTSEVQRNIVAERVLGLPR